MGKPKKPSRPATSATNNTADEELHGAARSGDLEAVQRICSTNPLAINSRDKHSRTPLHLAAWSGQTKVVEYLCKKADVGAAAMDDMGAIHFAAQKGHTEVVRILFNSGVPIKSHNRKGMTALHYAAQGSHLELVKYLIKKGATIDAKNKAGKTPVDLAGSEEIRAFLVQCQTTSSKEVLNGKGKISEGRPNSSLEENAGTAEIEVPDTGEEPDDERDESFKRKSDEDTAKDILPQTKKPKVALNHLLAADDTQEDDE
ncbi:unnamed protein product [Coffea canephora]|uniref:Uncharacterized protein n=1 Tax=Coffea canephora TaxID=49390 RepID=A0A068V363_COFCA|nr:unnamed protein product [Coffea canephora]